MQGSSQSSASSDSFVSALSASASEPEGEPGEPQDPVGGAPRGFVATRPSAPAVPYANAVAYAVWVIPGRLGFHGVVLGGTVAWEAVRLLLPQQRYQPGAGIRLARAPSALLAVQAYSREAHRHRLPREPAFWVVRAGLLVQL